MQKYNLKKMALAIFENLLRKFIKTKFILYIPMKKHNLIKPKFIFIHSHAKI